jgi:hypothetical protein
MLVLPNREAWRFETNLPTCGSRKACSSPSLNGMRRTDQIVLGATLARSTAVSWSFERLPEQGVTVPARRSAQQAELL